MFFSSRQITAVKARSSRWLLLLLGPIAAGCTVLHVPKPGSFDSPLPAFQGATSVSLVNAQTDTAIRTLGRAGVATLTGDLRAWTESAISLMNAELEKTGIKTQPDSKKSLKVAIVEANLGVSGIDFVAAVARCSVRLRLETGNGFVKEETYQNHALAPPSACDKAVTQAAQAALRTEEVVAYLRQ
jgi:uncharacterized protein (DUF1800 family)